MTIVQLLVQNQEQLVYSTTNTSDMTHTLVPHTGLS